MDEGIGATVRGRLCSGQGMRSPSPEADQYQSIMDAAAYCGAPWVNLPVSPSGMPWARVSAFIAWIVSATFACCTASLNHRSPWCSSPCTVVSTWGGPRRKGSPSCLVSGLIPAVDDLHLCETAVHEQLRSRDISCCHRTRDTPRPWRSLRLYPGLASGITSDMRFKCCSPVSVTCQAGVSVKRGLTAFTGDTGVGIP